jgi:hypothetical protein
LVHHGLTKAQSVGQANHFESMKALRIAVNALFFAR